MLAYRYGVAGAAVNARVDLDSALSECRMFLPGSLRRRGTVGGWLGDHKAWWYRLALF